MGKCRVGEWNEDRQRLELDEIQMHAAGVKVEANTLSDALADAMVSK